MAKEASEKDPTSARVRERLEQLRRDRRLTLKDLSARLANLGRPMSVSTLSKIANGDRRVDVDDLVALALALDVSPNAIILPAEASPGVKIRLTPAQALDAERSWLWATKDNPVDKADVFVSYVDTDEAWAAWVCAQLEAAGQRVRLQVSASPADEGAAAWINRQIQAATRTIALCSAEYIDSHWGTPDWAEAAASRRLIPLRVTDCTLPPALAALGWRDLYGIDEAAARHRLLGALGLAAAARAAASTGFPGAPAAAADTVPQPTRQPAVWNVQTQLSTFTGRRSLLDRIEADLAGEAAVALHGIGGVGKTQLAVEYCYRRRRVYDLVWWVAAEDPERVVNSLAALAEYGDVAVVGHAEESARAAVELLRTGGDGRFTRWLVVLDNPAVAPDDPLVDGLLGAAKAGGGHLLVTSRDQGWARQAAPVEVDVLPREDAVCLLRALAKGLSEEQAGRLANAVGDLPLALAQAGAWLAESGMSVDDYEDLLQRRARDVLTRGTATGQVPVAATWTVTLDEIAGPEPAAVMLVHLWAHLGPAPIPLDLLGAEVAGLVPEPLATAVRDPLALGDIVTRVSRLGLVRLANGEAMMHRLVQAVLRDHTPPQEREQLRTAVVRLLAAATDDPNIPANWPRYAQLYPHARAVDLIGSSDPGGRATVLRFADYLHYRGDDFHGNKLIRQARMRWAKSLGEDHPDTFVAAGHLAYMLREQGDYPAAQEVLEDVLSRCQRVLGDDHPNTIKAAACLGATLRAQGDYTAARELFENMESRCQRILGEDHPDTVNARANLAVTLREQGRQQAAQVLLEDVLRRRRRVLGKDHPNTIKAAACLGATLRAQADYTAARSLEDDVLSQRRRILGDDHPDTINAKANLALTLRGQGDYPAAQALLEDGLSRCRRVLGHDHPNTIKIAASLVLTLRDQEDYSAAHELEEYISARRRAPGDDNPARLRIRTTLDDMDVE